MIAGKKETMGVPVARHRFTVKDFYRMAEVGILSQHDHVELLDGEIVDMTPIGSRHAACVNRLNSLLADLLGQRAIVSVQNPIDLGPDSEPQPDLAVLRPRADFYGEAHPGPEDILMVIEVADTSADFDRTVKLPLYARAGIREAWVVDLGSESVEVHQGPAERGYQSVEALRRGQRLVPQAFPDLALAVADVLV